MRGVHAHAHAAVDPFLQLALRLLFSLGLLLQQLLLTQLLPLLDPLRLRRALGSARVVERVLILLLLMLLLLRWLLCSLYLLLLSLLLPLLLLERLLLERLLLLGLLVCGRRLHPLNHWPRLGLSALQRRGRTPIIFFVLWIDDFHRVALRLLLLLLVLVPLSLVALVLLQRRLLLDALGAASRCGHHWQRLLCRMLALQGVRGRMPLLLLLLLL